MLYIRKHKTERHVSYLCKVYDNAHLKCNTLAQLIILPPGCKRAESCADHLCCTPVTDACDLRVCDKCRGKVVRKTYENNKNDHAQWFQWDYVKESYIDHHGERKVTIRMTKVRKKRNSKGTVQHISTARRRETLSTYHAHKASVSHVP